MVCNGSVEVENVTKILIQIEFRQRISILLKISLIVILDCYMSSKISQRKIYKCCCIETKEYQSN